MPDPVFLPPSDAFGRTADLSFVSAFHPCGVPLEIRSNAQAALDLAESTYGPWRDLDATLVRPTLPARLDVIVLEATAEPLPRQLKYRRHGPVFMAAAGECLCSVLLEQRHAVCFVPRQALDEPEWFAAHVSGWGWLTVTQQDRVPVHAAAVAGDGCAAVVIGPSGSGKSTLAYACLAAGLQVLSEEAVFVSLDGPAPRLWGLTTRIWLDPHAVRFFPELAGRPAIERPTGKQRIAAPGLSAGARPLLTHSGPTVLVIHDRDDPAGGVRPADRRAVAEALETGMDEGFDQYTADRPAVDAWLGTLPAYRLGGGLGPAHAAEALRLLLATVASRRP